MYNLKEDAAVFTGKRALISFLSWLDYCDQLIKEAQKVLNQCCHCILMHHIVVRIERIKELLSKINVFVCESHKG